MDFWRGFSDFPATLDDPDDPILGYPICEVCGWRGAPINHSHELQNPESWEHVCKLSAAEVIRQIQETRIEPTFTEWMGR